jgi:hypothetical protein
MTPTVTAQRLRDDIFNAGPSLAPGALVSVLSSILPLFLTNKNQILLELNISRSIQIASIKSESGKNLQ